jgi:drug/metabolite transporter (DMT)-like permease
VTPTTASGRRGAAGAPAGGARTRGPAGLPGIAVAGLTAATSGVSVFVNSYGVHAIKSAAVYTTAKNLVAAVVLALVAVGARRMARGRSRSAATRFVVPERSGHSVTPESGPSRLLRWLCLAYVGLVGGGMAFVLFFEGLAATSATSAAFLHDTLVIWVAVLALPVLGERLRWWNGAAIAVLVIGQVAVAGGAGHLSADRGELLVLGATVLWAVEVVVAKILLRTLAPASLAVVRMGGGAVALLVYLAGTGGLHTLGALGGRQVGWALLTGLLLALYVGTWMTALARARAIDVSSVLVGSALVTALLQAMAGSASLSSQALGLLLIAAGTLLVALFSGRDRLRHPAGEAVG